MPVSQLIEFKNRSGQPVTSVYLKKGILRSFCVLTLVSKHIFLLFYKNILLISITINIVLLQLSEIAMDNTKWLISNVLKNSILK